MKGQMVRWMMLCILAGLLPLQMLPAQAIEGPADAELTALVDALDAEPGEVTKVGTAAFDPFLAYAAKHERNLFELLNLVYPLLEERNYRYRISGETLLESEEKYRLGRSKLRVILPIDSLIAMEIGARIDSSHNALDVFIEENYSADFYGFGVLHEEPHFGFREIERNYFNEAFGMYAKRMFFKLDVSHLHLYESEEVAIHLNNFFKPKREIFKAVRLQKK